MACICEGGYIRRDENSQESYLTLNYGREGDADDEHWFLRVVTLNGELHYMSAENFDARFCPLCGKEL